MQGKKWMRHLDREISGNSLVVPIGRNKDRSLSKASKTATQEEFELNFRVCQEADETDWDKNIRRGDGGVPI